MAISPVVQGFQSRLQGQGSQQLGMSPDQLSFNRKFGEAAYTMFQSKYPTLTPQVVTFKTVESDIETGFGLGAFVVAFGKDVVYVPAVMAGGSIVSCEMFYDKSADTVFPLVEGSVRAISNSMRTMESSVIQKPVMVENTRELFRNMFKPPASSNPVLAGVRGMDNSAKAAVATYLESNPELLAKIAEFYPIDDLVATLQQTPETLSKVAAAPAVSSVLTVSELTKELRTDLSEGLRKEAIDRGFLIHNDVNDKTSPTVIPLDSLAKSMVLHMGLVEVGGGEDFKIIGTGHLVQLATDGAPSIKTTPCLVTPSKIITAEGSKYLHGRETCVVSGFTDGVRDLTTLPFELAAPHEVVDKLNSLPTPDGYQHCAAIVLFPRKSGSYGVKNINFTCGKDGLSQTVIDDDITISSKHRTKVSFLNSIKQGCIELENGELIFPMASRVLIVPSRSITGVATLSALHKLFRLTGVSLSIVQNGAGLTLKDSTEMKTANFKDEARLAKYVIENYGFSKIATELLLSEKRVLFHKTAQNYGTNPNLEGANDASMQDGPANSLYANNAPQPMALNPEYLSAAAASGDKDIMDTGMLASLSGDEHLKTQMVDMLPSFIETTTKLGKNILLFCINKKQIEETYGSEQYGQVLNNNRKIFRMLGELIFDLQQLIGMSQK